VPFPYISCALPDLISCLFVTGAKGPVQTALSVLPVEDVLPVNNFQFKKVPVSKSIFGGHGIGCAFRIVCCSIKKARKQTAFLSIPSNWRLKNSCIYFVFITLSKVYIRAL
jgi:hypothetical protein